MLRTNTTKFRINVQNYITANFTPESYDEWNGNENSFHDVATFIYNTFHKEKVCFDKRRLSQQTLFVEWCSGLPGILDTCYYYNREARIDWATLKEATETESSAWEESDCEELISLAIWREIKKEVNVLCA